MIQDRDHGRSAADNRLDDEEGDWLIRSVSQQKSEEIKRKINQRKHKILSDQRLCSSTWTGTSSVGSSGEDDTWKTP